MSDVERVSGIYSKFFLLNFIYIMKAEIKSFTDFLSFYVRDLKECLAIRSAGIGKLKCQMNCLSSAEKLACQTDQMLPIRKSNLFCNFLLCVFF